MGKKQTGMNWLRGRMDALGYTSLEEVATAMSVNRGNLWRWFTLETSPSVAMLPVFCEVLDAKPLEVMTALEIVTKKQEKLLA